MRAIALEFIFGMYLLSCAAFITDVYLLSYTDLPVVGLDGNNVDTRAEIEKYRELMDIGNKTLNPEAHGQDTGIIDRVVGAATVTFASTWTLLSVIAGTYHLGVLHALGLPAGFITIVQMLMPILIAATVVYYVTGRR